MKDFDHEKNSPKTFFGRFSRNIAKFTKINRITEKTSNAAKIAIFSVNFAKFLENLYGDTAQNYVLNFNFDSFFHFLELKERA